MAYQVEVTAAFDGDGILVNGQAGVIGAGAKDGGFTLKDNLGHFAALGLATTTAAWMNGSQIGDAVLRTLGKKGRILLGTGSVSDFPAMAVSIDRVEVGDPNRTTNLEVNGDVKVSGDIILTGGADCAEDFDIDNNYKAEAGSVMVMNCTGKLEEGHEAYDKRVAGVISGAGNFKPAITLDKQPFGSNRQPIALLGKVYCKVDAQYSSIEVGDLLTTSPTIGHAMKALDPFKAFGAVIGKALKPLAGGKGLIPILVTLQ